MNVETSPLEDLLIEHPSMSVYRATASPIAPETPPPTPDAPDERNVEENVVLRDRVVVPGGDVATTTTPGLLERNPRRRREQEQLRTPSIHDGRTAAARSRRSEQRIVQLRSAQKVVYVIGLIFFFFFFFVLFLVFLCLLELLGTSNNCH